MNVCLIAGYQDDVMKNAGLVPVKSILPSWLFFGWSLRVLLLFACATEQLSGRRSCLQGLSQTRNMDCISTTITTSEPSGPALPAGSS
jgi:hypothetical protein